MGEKWASLYLIACSVLGDESEAGDWVMQARTQEELAGRLEGRAPLPAVLPVAALEVQEHVALLRRRALRRRQAMRAWGAAAVALVMGFGALALPTLGGGLRGDAERFEQSPVAAAESANWTFEVHDARADQDGLTIWWSLSGPGVALVGNEPMIETELELPRLPGAPKTTVRGSGRGRLTGATWLPVTVPPTDRVPLAIRAGGRAWAVEVPVDRSELIALERRVAINQVVSRRGAGIFVKSITLAPAYTVIDWAPWMAPEATLHFDTKLALSLRTDLGPVSSLSTGGPRSAHFGPVHHGAGRLIISSNELVWGTAVHLPLQSGEADGATGVTLSQVSREQNRLQIAAEAGNGYVPVETLVQDRAGRTYRPFSLQIRQGAPGQSELWKLQATFELPADVDLQGLLVRVVQQLPPLELVLEP